MHGEWDFNPGIIVSQGSEEAVRSGNNLQLTITPLLNLPGLLSQPPSPQWLISVPITHVGVTSERLNTLSSIRWLPSWTGIEFSHPRC